MCVNNYIMSTNLLTSTSKAVWFVASLLERSGEYLMPRLQAVVRPLLDENLQISLILQVERKTIVVSPHDLHDFLLLVC